MPKEKFGILNNIYLAKFQKKIGLWHIWYLLMLKGNKNIYIYIFSFDILILNLGHCQNWYLLTSKDEFVNVNIFI